MPVQHASKEPTIDGLKGHIAVCQHCTENYFCGMAVKMVKRFFGIR